MSRLFFLLLPLIFNHNFALGEVVKNATNQDDKSYAINEDLKSNIPTREEMLSIDKYDIVIGDLNAPVTIFEYSSLSCPHCANFHKDDFEKLKEDFIDKKVVRYIHRDFPTTKPAMMGSILARCSKNYEKFLNILFNSQLHWAYAKDYQEMLRGIAKLGGMENTQIESCFADSEISERIYKNTAYAAKVLGVKSTPTFIINGEIIEGAKYSKIKSLIEKAMMPNNQKE